MTTIILDIKITINGNHEILSPPLGNDASTINNNIAMISCTINTPMLSLPNTSSSNHLSPNNLTIIIVLLRDNAIPINKLVIIEYHNPRDKSPQNTTVNPT